MQLAICFAMTWLIRNLQDMDVYPGRASSNNKEFHEKVLLSHPRLVETFYDAIQREAVDAVKVKAIYALSTIIRNSIQARNDFYKLNGPALLTSILSEQSHSLRLRKKALTLATDLQISEKEYDIKRFSDKRFADLLMSLLKSGEMDMNEKSLLMIQSLIQHKGEIPF